MKSRRTAEGRLQRLAPFGALLEAGAPGVDVRSLEAAELRRLLRLEPFLVLRGFAPLGSEDFAAFSAAAFGPPLLWDFGSVLDLKVHEQPSNYLFAHGDVPLHWDGAFREATPRFLLFECLEAPPEDAGGQTLLSDTRRVWAELSVEQKAAWEAASLTYVTQKLAHYGGSVTVPLVAHRPGAETALRFAEPPRADTADLNPLGVSVDGLGPEESREFIARVSAAVRRPSCLAAHAWATGDFLIADNEVLLHGRAAFRRGAPRRILRVHALNNDNGGRP